MPDRSPRPGATFRISITSAGNIRHALPQPMDVRSTVAIRAPNQTNASPATKLMPR